MAKKIARALLVVVPIYNEQERLLDFMESLHVATTSYSYGCNLVVVNHQSTDNSLNLIKKQKGKFKSIKILTEGSPVKCGGKPRNTGFKYAINRAKSWQKKARGIVPIATLDADVLVSKKFADEIFEKLEDGYNIVSFSERYQQKKLLEWVNVQEEKRMAIKAIVGLSWLRHQILWGLILSGIKETRGPGGYAMLADTLEDLGHIQPLDRNGNPITGENNRLGILANRKGLKIYVSPYASRVHPRREMVSVETASQSKGYRCNKEKAELFRLARRKECPPRLSCANMIQYLNQGILRTIRMTLIRAVAFDKIKEISQLFENNIWRETGMLVRCFVENNKVDPEQSTVVGSSLYANMFDQIVENLGEKRVYALVKHIAGLLPTTDHLLIWAKDKSPLIKPDKCFSTQLFKKFTKKYSSL